MQIHKILPIRTVQSTHPSYYLEIITPHSNQQQHKSTRFSRPLAITFVTPTHLHLQSLRDIDACFPYLSKYDETGIGIRIWNIQQREDLQNWILERDESIQNATITPIYWFQRNEKNWQFNQEEYVWHTNRRIHLNLLSKPIHFFATCYYSFETSSYSLIHFHIDMILDS